MFFLLLSAVRYTGLQSLYLTSCLILLSRWWLRGGLLLRFLLDSPQVVKQHEWLSLSLALSATFMDTEDHCSCCSDILANSCDSCLGTLVWRWVRSLPLSLSMKVYQGGMHTRPCAANISLVHSHRPAVPSTGIPAQDAEVALCCLWSPNASSFIGFI